MTLTRWRTVETELTQEEVHQILAEEGKAYPVVLQELQGSQEDGSQEEDPAYREAQMASVGVA